VSNQKITLGKISALKGAASFEEFPSLDLTTPLRDNDHYSSSMMNSDTIKKY